METFTAASTPLEKVDHEELPVTDMSEPGQTEHMPGTQPFLKRMGRRQRETMKAISVRRQRKLKMKKKKHKKLMKRTRNLRRKLGKL
jgi:hypothetical protein